MGVMNVTPDSFSDGGSHLNTQNILISLRQFLEQGVTILDIGAESTAPMNSAISMEDEWSRLCLILKALKECPWPHTISLDSYKPSLVLRFFNALRDLGYSEDQFIWNDVSGVWDESVESFLTNFPQGRYVYCHNEAPERELAGSHMDYSVDSSLNITDHLVTYFSRAPLGEYQDRIILDPCFGFSKTYEQNLQLIENYAELVGKFQGHQWVFGISKKSFLRRWWQDSIGKNTHETKEISKEKLLIKSEFLHLLAIKKVFSSSKLTSSKGVIFRVHDPEIVQLASLEFPIY